MNKLFAANFVRLKKDKVFWLGILCMAFYGIYLVVGGHLDSVKRGYSLTLESVLFNYTMVIGIVVSVFVSLHLGTEYSDGTIRNKLVVGHVRKNIYLANLLTCIVAGTLMVIAYLIPTIVIGSILFDAIEIELITILGIIVGSIMMTAALAAIFTLLGMLIQNKAISAVVTILGMFTMLFVSLYMWQMLSAPESWPSYEYDGVGNITNTVIIPNDRYISGTKRVVYETAMEVLPTGQAMQYATGGVTHPWRLPLYSLSLVIVTTGIGIFVFQRKDIK